MFSTLSEKVTDCTLLSSNIGKLNDPAVATLTAFHFTTNAPVFANALAPMVVTPSPIVKSVNEEQP